MRKWRVTYTRLNSREGTAYHEAGHVAIAYEFGWWVRRGGVRISSWAHASLRHPESDFNNVRAQICVYMAGLLAEEKFIGQHWHFEEEVVDHLRALRTGQNEHLNLYPNDLRAIALALFEDDPTTTFADARFAVTYYHEQTTAMLNEPRVWGGVERVARALLRRRYPLSPRVVRQVLGDEFFVQTGNQRAGSHGPGGAARKASQLSPAADIPPH